MWPPRPLLSWPSFDEGVDVRRLPVLFLILVTGLGWADSVPKIEVGTVFVAGRATELVLRDGTYNNPVSRLIWDVPPSQAVYMTVEWPWSDRTATRISLRGAWPYASGSVTDEDWDTGTNPGDLKYGKSVSEGKLTNYWTANAEQTLELGPLRLLAGGMYRMTSWEAWNGTYRYEYNDTSVNPGSFSGLVLEYRQVWVVPYLGASLDIPVPDWTVVPSLRLSPYTWCFDIDNHMFSGALNRNTFQDYTRGGVYGQAAVEASTRAGSTTWGMRASWEIAWGATGETIQSQPAAVLTTNAVFSNSAGAWFQEFSLALFVRN